MTQYWVTSRGVITAIAARGRHVAVGVGYDGVIKTIELKLGAECTDG